MTNTITASIINGRLMNAQELDNRFNTSTDENTSKWYSIQLYLCEVLKNGEIGDTSENPTASFTTFADLANYMEKHDLRTRGMIGTMLHFYVGNAWVDMII